MHCGCNFRWGIHKNRWVGCTTILSHLKGLFADVNLLLHDEEALVSGPTHTKNLGSQVQSILGRGPLRRRTKHIELCARVGMQTCLHSSAFSLPFPRHTPCAGSTSLPLFRDGLHQKCTAIPSTSGRTLTCSAAPPTLQNYTATAVESKRGIKTNSTELIGDTPMVRGKPNEGHKGRLLPAPSGVNTLRRCI